MLTHFIADRVDEADSAFHEYLVAKTRHTTNIVETKDDLTELVNAKNDGNYGPSVKDVKPGDLYIDSSEAGAKTYYVVRSVGEISTREHRPDRKVSVAAFKNEKSLGVSSRWVNELLYM